MTLEDFSLEAVDLDADGRVERFVWALTDTTVQDEDTAEDEGKKKARKKKAEEA